MNEILNSLYRRKIYISLLMALIVMARLLNALQLNTLFIVSVVLAALVILTLFIECLINFIKMKNSENAIFDFLLCVAMLNMIYLVPFVFKIDFNIQNRILLLENVLMCIVSMLNSYKVNLSTRNGLMSALKSKETKIAYLFLINLLFIILI